MTFARSFSAAYDQSLTGLKLFLGTFYQFLAINNVELSNCKSIFITQLNVHNNQKLTSFYLQEICMRIKKIGVKIKR